MMIKREQFFIILDLLKLWIDNEFEVSDIFVPFCSFQVGNAIINHLILSADLKSVTIPQSIYSKSLYLILNRRTVVHHTFQSWQCNWITPGITGWNGWNRWNGWNG